MKIRCEACGEQVDLEKALMRTSEPACYVFQGASNDPRNGMKFHTKSGLKLPWSPDATIVIRPPDELLTERSQGNPGAPDRRRN